MRNNSELERTTTASPYREVKMRDGRTLAYAEYGSPAGQPVIYCHGVPSSRAEGDLAIPNCRAIFYPDDAHLSVPLNHQQEIFGALAVASAAA
jgi:hypothetical protein